MGFWLSKAAMDQVLLEWEKENLLFAPVRYEEGGKFSDTDCIRYGEIKRMDEVAYDKKAEYSFKETILPVSETLFYFTEDAVKESDARKKSAIVFLRSCDLHGVKRLDEIYLHNQFSDHYYKRLRDKVKFVWMPCKNAFDSCFCADMGTNRAEGYALSVEPDGEGYLVDCKDEEMRSLIASLAEKTLDVSPSVVTETKTRVEVPEYLTQEVMKSKIWEEYDSRCINCGRCNFVCPTCTCFTMQDIFYTDNGKVGERRRVWASCMVDGYSDVAGGGSYRKKNGERMRYKVLHKVLDYNRRNGYHMCVGCGRCDDVCPEYISFSHCVNKLGEAMKEVEGNDAK